MANQFLYTVPYKELSSWSYGLLVHFDRDIFKFPTEKLGCFLKKYENKADLISDTVFTRITIKTKGQGVVKRDEAFGKDIKTQGQFYVRAGQFIYSNIDARNGAFGVVPKNLDMAIITNSFTSFECDETKLLPQYLVLLLSTPYYVSIFEKISVGTTNRRSVKPEALLNIKIPVPPIEKQRELINEYEKKMIKIHQIKTTDNFYDFVDKFLTKELNIIRIEQSGVNLFSVVPYSRFNTWGVEYSKINYTNSNLYQTKTIKQICMVGSGGTPSRNKPSFYDGNIPWIKTGEVNNDVILDTEEKISDDAVRNSNAKIYKAGSIIMAMYGQGKTRGRTAKLGIDASTNQACAVMSGFSNEIYPDYLWVYLMGEYNHIRPLATGNNQPNLSIEKIKNYEIVIPPYLKQIEIANYILKQKEKLKGYEFLCRQLMEQAKQDFENAIFN